MYVLCGHNMEKLLSLFDFMEYVGQFGFQESLKIYPSCILTQKRKD